MFSGRRLPFITVVSGLPRSGTSMMMKMLEAGGISPLTDHLRQPDDDNPKGYYEYERVKQLQNGDTEWLCHAKGKTVKIISALLHHLPPEHQYRIIFMEREIEEVLASQKKMLMRRGEKHGEVSDEELAALFRKHIRLVENWLREQQHASCLRVRYNTVLQEPQQAVRQISSYLGNRLDTNAMLSVIDPALHRNRAAGA